MKYTRIYSDASGESHFEDVETELAPANFVASAPPMDLSAPVPATQFGFINTATGWSSDWHPAPGRNFFFILSGEWEVTTSDGETRRFVKGNAVLTEDTTGKGHASRVISESLVAAVKLSD